MTVLAIDPGTTESAYVILDAAERPVEFAKVCNTDLLGMLRHPRDCGRWSEIDVVAIEMIASYGMGVGAEVFETCVMIGRLVEAAAELVVHRVYRKDVKLYLCGSPRAKDTNIRAALIDRYGGKAATKKGGPLHGITGDCWAALAVALTYLHAPRSAAPGQKDSAIQQMRTIWETGT